MLEKKPKIHLDNYEEYRTSVLRYLEWMLARYYGDISKVGISDIKKDADNINVYENFDFLEPVREDRIFILDDKEIDTKRAEEAVLAGKIIWEHTAAGEATRLGLGTKYLLNLSRFSVGEIVNHMRREVIKDWGEIGPNEMDLRLVELEEKININKILEQMGGRPDSLLDISLGNRHMLQMSFDIWKLAEQHGLDPEDVLAKQKAFIILNEGTADEIIDGFRNFRLFGLRQENIYFMVQRSFHGIYIKEGTLFFDTTTEKNKRLHNHGQLIMQKIHDNVIFQVDFYSGRRNYIPNIKYEEILREHDDLLSHNVEDLGYLTGSIDLTSLSLALDLGSRGYDMVMEIVAQNPIKPQKGGACFYDKKLERIVMIESSCLKGMKNEDIKHLNKNFNHYTNPSKSFGAMKEQGLPLSFEVKTTFDQNGEPTDYIYPCPVQGDMNLLVNTAFVMRKNMKPITGWKSPATTPAAVRAMLAQDKQAGFTEFLKKMSKK